MIIEFLFQWLVSVLNFAISLLPVNGSMFDSIPKLDASFFKQITMLNGYLPIQETGTAFGIMIAVEVALFAVGLLLGAFNYLTKVKP